MDGILFIKKKSMNIRTKRPVLPFIKTTKEKDNGKKKRSVKRSLSRSISSDPVTEQGAEEGAVCRVTTATQHSAAVHTSLQHLQDQHSHAQHTEHTVSLGPNSAISPSISGRCEDDDDKEELESCEEDVESFVQMEAASGTPEQRQGEEAGTSVGNGADQNKNNGEDDESNDGSCMVTTEESADGWTQELER